MKMRRFIIFISFILILINSSIYPQWTIQNSGVTSTLNDVCFVDELNGWVVGDNSVILRTTDGGSTWQNQTIVDEIYDIKKIEMLSLFRGYLIDDNGSLWALKNESWKKLLIPNNNSVYDISFISADTGWIISSDSCYQYILYTNDGGNYWEELLSNYAPNYAAYEGIKTVKFINQNTGFYLRGTQVDAMDDTKFFKTINGGLNWELVGTSSFTQWIISCWRFG